jgi:hypothetical protein
MRVHVPFVADTTYTAGETCLVPLATLSCVSRRTWLGAGIGVGGLVAAAVGVWYVALRDVAEPATVGEAVTTFRESGGGVAAGRLPAGVYVYETHGFETTDALTGVTHRYPPRSTITVTKGKCGPELRWDVLKGRSTVWTFCRGPAEWTLESQDERHTFFGRTEHTDYTCRDLTFWSKEASAAPRAYRCETDDASEQGEVRLAAQPFVVLPSRRVRTVRVRRTSTFTGAIRGSSVYDFWLDRATGVPVLVTMESATTNDSPVGAVHYQERVALRLTSLTPRR